MKFRFPSVPAAFLKKMLRRVCAVVCAGTLLALAVFFVAASRPVGDLLEDWQRAGTTPFAELRPADVIVVLGGDEGTRSLGAAKAFRAGLAPSIVVSSDEDFILDALAASGIPRDAIFVDPLAKRTIDHPDTIRKVPEISLSTESRLIVSSSRFQERRAKFLFERAGFRDVQIYSLDADRMAFQCKHPEKFSRPFWHFRRVGELAYAYLAWVKYFIAD